MTGPLRIVLAAHPRSGSNCLVEILNLAPDVSILNEPFHERFTTWSPDHVDYRARVNDGASLDAVTAEIFASWTGFKLLGYQLDLDLYEHLLLRPDVHVIFLRRRNLLETVVSNLIALQTDLWKTWDADGRIEDRYDDLAPIPIDEVENLLRYTRTRLEETDAILARRHDRRVLTMTYEDLYLAPPAAQDAELGRLWDFLDLAPPQDPRLRYYLDPNAVQMGGATTYGRLPNAAQIDAALGSDAYGRLTYLR